MCRLCISMGVDCVVVFPVYCCSHCVCRLCIVQGDGCVVNVTLFITARSLCVGYVLSWAVIACYCCCFTVYCCCHCACESCVLSWAVIALLMLHCLLLPPMCV